MPSQRDVRCFCARQTLLARILRNDAGKVVLHVKVFRQKKIQGEVYVAEGEVWIRCRNCMRLHRVRVLKQVTLTAEPLPSGLPQEDLQGASATRS